jgi:HK97 family phage major capsid protein
MAHVSRTDAEVHIPEAVSSDILENAGKQSVALQLIQSTPLSTKITKMPVLASLPTAAWVTGDTGRKTVSNMSWTKKFFTVEELAVIVPVPEAVLDDADFSLLEAIRVGAAGAIAAKLDETVFFGTEDNGKPDSFPLGLVPGAIAAGKTVELGGSAVSEGGIATDFSRAFAQVEKSGRAVSGVYASSSLRPYTREANDANGAPSTRVSTDTIHGVPVRYSTDGLFVPGEDDVEALALAGDFSAAKIGVRQDVTYKLLDQATLQNADGSIMYNLAQQDMVAVRVVARYAFVLANPVNRGNLHLSENDRYAFSAVTAPALVTP